MVYVFFMEFSAFLTDFNAQKKKKDIKQATKTMNKARVLVVSHFYGG